MVVNNSEFLQPGSTGPTSLLQKVYELLIAGGADEVLVNATPGELPVWTPIASLTSDPPQSIVALIALATPEAF